MPSTSPSFTSTGVVLQVPSSQGSGPALMPLPSSPRVLSPQALSVPLFSRARLKRVPAAMALTSLRYGPLAHPPIVPDAQTATGVLLQDEGISPHVSGPAALP